MLISLRSFKLTVILLFKHKDFVKDVTIAKLNLCPNQHWD